MAKNTGKGYREGAVKGRSQTYNPETKTWVERDTKTGRFENVISSGKPAKGVRKERRVGARASGVATPPP
jgi:hypothetical protein